MAEGIPASSTSCELLEGQHPGQDGLGVRFPWKRSQWQRMVSPNTGWGWSPGLRPQLPTCANSQVQGGVRVCSLGGCKWCCCVQCCQGRAPQVAGMGRAGLVQVARGCCPRRVRTGSLGQLLWSLLWVLHVITVADMEPMWRWRQERSEAGR
jgi:hypothetical protein